jgi:hypothetical protein
MYTFRKVFLGLLAATTMAPATVGVVHDLTNNTFRGFVEENDMVLVGFVLPFLPVSRGLNGNTKRYKSHLYVQMLERLTMECLYRQLEYCMALEFNSRKSTA